MNIDDAASEFWSLADEMESGEIMEALSRKQGIGVGVDLNNRLVVIGTPGGFVDMNIEMARAMAYGLILAADALQNHISKTN